MTVHIFSFSYNIQYCCFWCSCFLIFIATKSQEFNLYIWFLSGTVSKTCKQYTYIRFVLSYHPSFLRDSIYRRLSKLMLSWLIVNNQGDTCAEVSLINLSYYFWNLKELIICAHLNGDTGEKSGRVPDLTIASLSGIALRLKTLLCKIRPPYYVSLPSPEDHEFHITF